jgi:D-beta-D-heptose 7-phosphate kinase/D-beta-D-heptose 1-phosphate adenosyltransferase
LTDVLHPVPRERVLELLQDMDGVRVVVLGDLMLDRYLFGDADRISDEAPVPIVSVVREENKPGGAANAAANVVGAGAVARLVGVVGDDATGEALRESLRQFEIPPDGVLTIPGRPTTAKTRIIARGQQVVRIDREVSNPLPAPYRKEVRSCLERELQQADVLLIEDYDKGLLDSELTREAIALAGARQVPVVVDPKLRNMMAYAGATVIKPNRRELETVFGTHFTGEDSDLEEVRERLGAAHLLLTLGADGMVLVSPGSPLRHTPSVTREVFDVTGAGDTVAAWLAASLGAGAAIEEAAWISNLAAGVEVGHQGAAAVSPDELLDAWEERLGQ